MVKGVTPPPFLSLPKQETTPMRTECKSLPRSARSRCWCVLALLLTPLALVGCGGGDGKAEQELIQLQTEWDEFAWDESDWE